MTKSVATPAIDSLMAAGVRFILHPYELTEAAETYGEAVAATLGVEPERLFKTLIVEVDGSPVVGIVPVASRLSLKGLARAADGKRAEMADPALAERVTGYVTGGISPFGQKRRLRVYVDESVELFDSVFVSAGKRGLQVELSPSALIDLLDAHIADLT
jgi:Cys-tRNA(Pro)/Cys-tRNA(Cys) deacylase